MVSVKRASNKAKAADAKMRQNALTPSMGKLTSDSFQNFAARLGMGTDNVMAQSSYGFNPVTRVRTLLEWIHRGSWIGGMAVDIVADDMTRQGIDFTGSLDPDDEETLQQELVVLGVWDKLNEGLKWGRLYGGAIMVPLLDGQSFSTVLRPETVGKDQFKGLAVLDRWSVDPNLQNLVTEYGPSLGLPKFYKVIGDSAVLPKQNIHYSRAFRTGGIKLPQWQAIQENLWDMSIIERLYDRMVAFDSATTGAAQLVYKSYLRTIKIKDLREVVSNGGTALAGLAAQVNFMSRYQGIEGVTLLDAEDEFEGIETSAFNGLAKALDAFGQQLSGALQIPLVRLFGQSPAGLSSTGESDLRTYYDNIKQQQEKTLRVPMMKVLTVLARSKGIALPKDFNFMFRSLWQMTDKERSEISESNERAVQGAFDSGIIDRPTALKELKQSSMVSGMFTNITDDMIKEAEAEPPRPGEFDPETGEYVPMPLVGGNGGEPGEGGEQGGDDLGNAEGEKPTKAAKDGAALLRSLRKTKDLIGCQRDYLGLPLMIEAKRGEMRCGYVQVADYGYIQRTGSAEGADENMDCFVGPLNDHPTVYVIDSYWDDGRFDEHKVMLGFNSSFAAVEVFARTYVDSRHVGAVTECSVDDLKIWLASGDMTKPMSADIMSAPAEDKHA